MPWRWEDIERDWSAGSPIAYDRNEILQAFEIADRCLGEDWVRGQRVRGDVVVSGFAPILTVVSVGKQLQAVEGCIGADDLFGRIVMGNRAAFAELAGIYIARASGVEIEIGQDVRVGKRIRKPDFRMRFHGEEWIYVEVTAPELSEFYVDVATTVERVKSNVFALPNDGSIEILFRRDPEPEEFAILAHEIGRAWGAGDCGIREFRDLALLAVNLSPDGQQVIYSSGEKPPKSRISQATVQIGSGRVTKRVITHIPYSDRRAEAFLTSEARQLPKEFSGLIMIDVTRTLGGLNDWIPLIQNRLQPNLHTRISGVCLFQPELRVVESGMEWFPNTCFVRNPHARMPLAAWANGRLNQFKLTVPKTSNV